MLRFTRGTIALLVLLAVPAGAARPVPQARRSPSTAALLDRPAPGEPTFPRKVTDDLLRKLNDVGRVEFWSGKWEDDTWRRWGRATRAHQEMALRAVAEALAIARPPISLSAAILAIARVESGFNPYSQNPTSTACGIFQFIKATW